MAIRGSAVGKIGVWNGVWFQIAGKGQRLWILCFGSLC